MAPEMVPTQRPAATGQWGLIVRFVEITGAVGVSSDDGVWTGV